MVFNCDKCDYQTTRKYNLVLHYKRLTPCNLTKQKKNTSNGVKLELKTNDQNVKTSESNINADEPNMNADEPNINVGDIKTNV
jgi:hypothetical protein